MKWRSDKNNLQVITSCKWNTDVLPTRTVARAGRVVRTPRATESRGDKINILKEKKMIFWAQEFLNFWDIQKEIQ